MPKFTEDISNWPLARMTLEGTPSLDQHMSMLATWNRWFERRDPFYALRIHQDEAALTPVAGVGKATKDWMQNGARAAIKAHVRAMMIVVPPQCLAATYKMNVETVFEIPGGIFGHVSDALKWLETQDNLSDETLRALSRHSQEK